MRLKNVRDGHAGLTRRLDVNIAVRARVKHSCDSFIIIADQIGKLSNAFRLDGFENERHRRDLTRSRREVQLATTNPCRRGERTSAVWGKLSERVRKGLRHQPRFIWRIINSRPTHPASDNRRGR